MKQPTHDLLDKLCEVVPIDYASLLMSYKIDGISHADFSIRVLSFGQPPVIKRGQPFGIIRPVPWLGACGRSALQGGRKLTSLGTNRDNEYY